MIVQSTRAARNSVLRALRGPAVLPGLIFAMTLSRVAGAVDLYVATNGVSTGMCPATNRCSLGRALRRSGPGDTLHLQAGTYQASTIKITLPLTLVGEGAGITTIDARNKDRAFDLDPGAGNTVSLQAFTVRNGTTTGDGGAARIASGRLEVLDAVLTGNQASVGGAIDCTDCEGITVKRTALTDNTAGAGGAINVQGDNSAYIMPSALIDSCTLTGNSATDSHAGGGAINAQVASLTVDNTQCTNNTTVGSGGCIEAQFSPTTIHRSSFETNSAAAYGGALLAYSYAGDELVSINSTFYANSAADGGAIYADGTTSSVVNVTLADNLATASGGAADVHADGSSTFVLANSLLTHPASGGSPQCTGALAGNLGGSYNLIDAKADCQGPGTKFAPFRSGALRPLALGPVGLHGGTTDSISLPAGSNAVDLIPGPCLSPATGLLLAADQRLQPRPLPVGLAFPPNTRCDVGAFER